MPSAFTIVCVLSWSSRHYETYGTSLRVKREIWIPNVLVMMFKSVSPLRANRVSFLSYHNVSLVGPPPLGRGMSQPLLGTRTVKQVRKQGLSQHEFCLLTIEERYENDAERQWRLRDTVSQLCTEGSQERIQQYDETIIGLKRR